MAWIVSIGSRRASRFWIAPNPSRASRWEARTAGRDVVRSLECRVPTYESPASLRAETHVRWRFRRAGLLLVVSAMGQVVDRSPSMQRCSRRCGWRARLQASAFDPPVRLRRARAARSRIPSSRSEVPAEALQVSPTVQATPCTRRGAEHRWCCCGRTHPRRAAHSSGKNATRIASPESSKHRFSPWQHARNSNSLPGSSREACPSPASNRAKIEAEDRVKSL